MAIQNASGSTGHRPRLKYYLLAAIVALAGAVAPAVASNASGTYNDVHIVDQAGTPIPDASVYLSGGDDNAFGTTDASGNVELLTSIDEAPWVEPWVAPETPTDYSLTVSYDPITGPSTTYYWAGTAFSTESLDSTAISIASSGTTLEGELPFELSSGSISGTITSNPALAGHYYAQLFESAEESHLATAAGDVDGDYTFVGVPPGTYRLFLGASSSASAPYGYEGTWFGGDSHETADDVVVTDGAVTGINGTVNGLASVSGSLYELVGGNPQIVTDEEAAVVIYPAGSTTNSDDARRTRTFTGEYEFTLAAGDYKVAFGTLASGAGWDAFVPIQYFDRVDIAVDATVLELEPGQTLEEIDGVYGGFPLPEPERIAGDDRFATAAAVAQEYSPTEVEAVYITNGLNYPDALSAAPAAAYYGAPLLLVGLDTLPSVIAAEITRLEPERIVVVGGTGVVSASVATQLEALLPGTQVTRIGGENRYETSRLVTWDAFGVDGADDVFIATGTNFPDALSASAAAGARSGPVILVNGQASTVDAATLELLDDLGTDRAALAGGTGVVSTGIQTQLGTVLGGANVERLAGADRYGTSIAINTAVFDTADVVYLAVGTGYADALAGAALAGKNHAPLFIVPGNCVPQAVIDAIVDFGADEVILFGGIGALSAAVENLTPC
jgi:putative cell wall-binding protein